MTFVLLKQRTENSLPTVPDKFQASKIFQNSDPPATEDLHSFLGVRSVSVREVADCSLRAIGKLNRYDQVIVGTGYCARIISLYAGWRRTCQKAEKIHEMADFAKNSASALLRIIYPMIGIYRARIHPVMHRQRLLDFFYECLHSYRHGCETTVEADHQQGFLRLTDVVICANDLR